MGRERVAEVLGRFETLHREVRAEIAGLTADEWCTICPAEGWPAGFLARHIAVGYGVAAACLEGVRSGQPVAEVTLASIHSGNSAALHEHATITQAEVLAYLDDQAERLRAAALQAEDDHLDRPAFTLEGRTFTAGDMYAGLLFEHTRGHLASLRTAHRTPVAAG